MRSLVAGVGVSFVGYISSPFVRDMMPHHLFQSRLFHQRAILNCCSAGDRGSFVDFYISSLVNVSTLYSAVAALAGLYRWLLLGERRTENGTGEN